MGAVKINKYDPPSNYGDSFELKFEIIKIGTIIYLCVCKQYVNENKMLLDN